MDVAVWLRGLGLERYEQVFHENRIEADVLPRLGDWLTRRLWLSACR